MNRKWIGVAGAAFLLLVPLLNRFNGRSSTYKINVMRVAERGIHASILASGSLTFQEQTQLSPEVIGRVTSVLVNEGDFVRKDQVMLRIDDESYQATVAQQIAAVQQQRLGIDTQTIDVRFSEFNLKRVEALYKQQAASKSGYDDALQAAHLARINLQTSRAALVQAEAILNQARKLLAKTIIRAPITGTVVAVNIKVGETAVPSTIGIAGSNLLTIANTSTIVAEIDVDEADITRVRVRQGVALHVMAYPDVTFAGTVTAISISPKNRNNSFADRSGQQSGAGNYTIKVDVHGRPDFPLRSGMSCRAEIFISTSKKALAVPVQAIMASGDRDETREEREHRASGDESDADDYVFVVEGGEVHKRTVRIGVSDDEYQEIIAGLKAREIIAVGPYKTLHFLTDGESVSVAASDRSNQ